MLRGSGRGTSGRARSAKAWDEVRGDRVRHVRGTSGSTRAVKSWDEVRRERGTSGRARFAKSWDVVAGHEERCGRQEPRDEERRGEQDLPRRGTRYAGNEELRGEQDPPSRGPERGTSAALVLFPCRRTSSRGSCSPRRSSSPAYLGSCSLHVPRPRRTSSGDLAYPVLPNVPPAPWRVFCSKRSAPGHQVSRGGGCGCGTKRVEKGMHVQAPPSWPR